MTQQEALKELENLTIDYGKRTEEEIERLDEAVDMAIAALRANAVDRQPCEDAVSRAAAINAVKKNTFRLTFAEEQGCEGHVVWSAEAVYSDVIEGALLELPSTQSHDIARDIATIIENEKDMRVILKNAQPDAPDTNGGDIIYRQAAIDALESIGSLDTEADKKYARSVFEALPSAQPETHEERTETHDVCLDTISRQAAIDVLSLGKEILSRVLDDMDVVGTDREKYSWGLGLIESDIKDIEELPSAQPDSKYEYHYDHTDCIWYRPEARNRCPTTCAQYRDGWNDAMNYIFRDGKGYRPYRRDEKYETN